jgi:hypothetical protein
VLEYAKRPVNNKQVEPSIPKAGVAGKVTLVQKDGKTYHVFPAAANNQAYVGGPEQYQAYKQLLGERDTDRILEETGRVLD